VDLVEYVHSGSVRQPRLGVITGRLWLQDGRRSDYAIYGGNVPFIRQPSMKFYGFNEELDEDTSLDIPGKHDGHFVWADLSKDNGLELIWESQDGFMALAVPPDMIDWAQWARATAAAEAWRQEWLRRYHAARRSPGPKFPSRPLELPPAPVITAAAAAAAAALLLLLRRG